MHECAESSSLLNKNVIVKILQDAECEALRNQFERKMYSYKRARVSIQNYDKDLISPSEILDIKYIGKSIAGFIKKKFLQYEKNDSSNDDTISVGAVDHPQINSNTNKNSSRSINNKKRSSSDVLSQRLDLLNHEISKSKTLISEKKSRVYIPRVGSGNWAILLALYLHAANGQAIEEPLLKTLADQYSKDSMFNNPQKCNYYCAFSTFHKKLIDEEKLVIKRLVPKRYILSFKGRELAARLYEQSKDVLEKMNLKLPTDIVSLNSSNTINDENQENEAFQPNFTNSFLSASKKNTQVTYPKKSSSVKLASDLNKHNVLHSNKLSSNSETNTIQVSPLTETITLEDDSSETENLSDSSQTFGDVDLLKVRQENKTFLHENGSQHATYLSNKSVIHEKSEIFLKFQVGLQDILKNKSFAHKIVNVVLVVDSREKRQVGKDQDQDYFKTSLSMYGLNVDTRALPLGDFLWIGETDTNENIVLDFLVERKISMDLSSSIIDRRYYEQKWRIRHSGISKTCYLVEGSLKGYQAQKSGIKMGSLSNSVLSTEYVDELMIFRTRDIKETITHLYAITKWIENKYKGKTVYTSEDDITLMLKVKHNGWTTFELERATEVIGLEDLLFTYGQYLKHNAKTKKLPVIDLFGKQLMNIPNVSAARAAMLIKTFKTPMNLYQTLMLLPNRKERIDLISNITVNGRCLGKTIANHILNIYYPD